MIGRDDSDGMEGEELMPIVEAEAARSTSGWEQELAQEREQGRALLDEHEGSDDYGEKPKAKETMLERLRTCRAKVPPMATYVIASMTAFFLILVAMSMFLKPLVKSTGDSQAKARLDYILDSKWDYGEKSTRREYNWVIRDQEHNPDGVYRPMMLINGQYPGPLIECNEGDTIVVNIDNQAVNATSFHWHGLFQNGTNYMDGTIGVTQCAIAPGKRFTYEFQASGQSGTYWYHAHQAVQSSDGLLGPFIIHSKKEKELQKLSYSTDRIIMIQDHYHNSSSSLLMTYLASDRENVEPIPDSGLINGKNSMNCSSLPQRNCSDPPNIPVFNLNQNQNHRLRFINVGAFAEFSVQIDEHQFAVTEVDGTDVEPAYYHRLNINPGQRYSIILSTNITTADVFWMRARMVTNCFREQNKALNPEIKAVIRYDRGDAKLNGTNASRALPKTNDWPEPVEILCKDMNSSGLHPVDVISTPKTSDGFFFLRATFQIGDWRLSRGFFNESSWRADIHSPSLHRVIDGYATHNSSFTGAITGVNDKAFHLPREMVIQLDRVANIDIVFQNFDDGNHPLHLHGHKFFVLGQGHGYFKHEFYDSADFSNPLRRDTASMEGFGWILIRVVTDNPGIWAFHCHTSWHAQSGMMLQLLTRPDLVGRWKLPAANQELCKADGLEKGEGPSDDVWVGNFG
jgi:FtsP/CotA-like multicopper oxidase with cupredoxin domain